MCVPSVIVVAVIVAPVVVFAAAIPAVTQTAGPAITR
jgi:hypothetical protein